MHLLKLFGLVTGIAVSTLIVNAPISTAKEPKNYSWDNIQVITATPGCGNEIWTSRYNSSGRLLGSKMLARAAQGFQATPYELDYRTNQRPRNLLLGTYDCNLKKSRLYTWDLASPKGRPVLIVDLPATDTLFDAAYDPATQNVVFLRWGPSSTMSVEMLPPSGGPTTQLWSNGTSNVALAPTKLLMDTGGEFSLLGRPSGAGLQDAWIRLQLDSRRPMSPGAVTASGPGQIESASTGSFKLFDSGNVYTASGSQGWLCASPPTSVLVTEDRNCVTFRPVANRFPGSRVYWSFGTVRNAASSSALLYWWGDGQNYVQPIGVDPTGRPNLGQLTALRGGPGQSGSILIPAADFDRALDALKIKVPTVR